MNTKLMILLATILLFLINGCGAPKVVYIKRPCPKLQSGLDLDQVNIEYEVIDEDR